MKKIIILSFSFWSTVAVIAQSKVGINTNAPTASLDVNGNIRVRSNFPAKSSVLICADGNGTATWQKLSAFRVEGESTGQGYTAIGSVYTSKFAFGSIPEYNIGFGYSANASTFTAPVKGIYHFDANITTYKKEISSVANGGGPNIHLVRGRGNNTQILDQSHFYMSLSNAGTMYGPELSNRLGGDFILEAGGELWINFQTDQSQLVYGDKFKHFFCGHLVTQIF